MLFNRPLTVSELNKHTKDLLETHFLTAEITGEVSGFVAAASGHWYFTLKDSKAQVKCAMFRGQNRSVIRPPQNGDKIKIKARVTLYEARGDFQLVANSLEHDGTGALLAAYERLKTKLENEGLFSQSNKKSIPKIANNIGIITSPTGAAIQDILHVTERRFPNSNVCIYPTQVQGSDAPVYIMQALRSAIDHGRCDVLIIGRGGGSIEDLWCFNDEQLARAIYHCPIPIISAVGHEVDFTIADFVADLRAPTPSAAAEIVTPDRHEWNTRFSNIEKRLTFATQQKLRYLRSTLSLSQSKLINPKFKLEKNSQRLDDLTLRLEQAIKNQIGQQRSKSSLLQSELFKFHPEQKLAKQRLIQTQLHERLKAGIEQQLLRRQYQFQNTIRSLQLISPLNTLERGYSITSDGSGKVIQSIENTKIGDPVNIRLHDGNLKATITKLDKL